MSDMQGTFELTVIAVVIVLPSLVGIVAYLLVPRSLRDFARKNATRYDGSFSQRRWERELRARWRYLGSVTIVPLLILMPLAVVAALMHQWVVPVDLAVAAMERFDPDTEKWKENLKDPSEGAIGSAHDSWAEGAGLSPELAATWQHSLWQAWPVVIAGGLVTLVICLAMTAQVYVRAFRQYHDGVVARSREYLEVDLARIAVESGATDVS